MRTNQLATSQFFSEKHSYQSEIEKGIYQLEHQIQLLKIHYHSNKNRLTAAIEAKLIYIWSNAEEMTVDNLDVKNKFEYVLRSQDNYMNTLQERIYQIEYELFDREYKLGILRNELTSILIQSELKILDELKNSDIKDIQESTQSRSQALSMDTNGSYAHLYLFSRNNKATATQDSSVDSSTPKMNTFKR